MQEIKIILPTGEIFPDAVEASYCLEELERFVEVANIFRKINALEVKTFSAKEKKYIEERKDLLRRDRIDFFPQDERELDADVDGDRLYELEKKIAHLKKMQKIQQIRCDAEKDFLKDQIKWDFYSQLANKLISSFVKCKDIHVIEKRRLQGENIIINLAGREVLLVIRDDCAGTNIVERVVSYTLVELIEIAESMAFHLTKSCWKKDVELVIDATLFVLRTDDESLSIERIPQLARYVSEKIKNKKSDFYFSIVDADAEGDSVSLNQAPPALPGAEIETPQPLISMLGNSSFFRFAPFPVPGSVNEQALCRQVSAGSTVTLVSGASGSNQSLPNSGSTEIEPIIPPKISINPYTTFAADPAPAPLREPDTCRCIVS